jgi:uncharacterized protein
MFEKFRLTRYEKSCATKFSGSCNEPPWSQLYDELPFKLMEMANRDVPKAAYVLGDIFDQGMGEIERDLDKALLYYRMGETIDDPDALNNLGSMHYRGEGLPKDLGRAFQYFEKAAVGGCATAMNNLARMYLDGEGGLDIDIEKGIGLLQEGAEAFDVNAALKLKSIYYQGSYNQPKDMFKYVRWLWQCAYNRHGDSFAVIGELLSAGQIVKRQPERVRPLYKEALEFGSGYGALCLGLDYCSGKNGDQSVEMGLMYLRLAEEYGEEGVAEIILEVEKKQAEFDKG